MEFDWPEPICLHSETDTENCELDANQDGPLQTTPCVVGSFALATRLNRIRSASAGAHRVNGNEGGHSIQPGAQGSQFPRATAIETRMLLRRPTAIQTPIVPHFRPTPPSTPKSPSGRSRFRVRAKFGVSDHENHVLEAAGDKYEVPCLPMSPKPEKGLRPWLRACAFPSDASSSFPSALQHEGTEVPNTEHPKGDATDTKDTFTRASQCCSRSSLDEVMVQPNELCWLED